MMIRFFSSLLLIGSMLWSVQGQKPVALRAMALAQAVDAPAYALFTPAVESKGTYEDVLRQAHTLMVKDAELARLQADKPALVELTLPEPFSISLLLYQQHPFDPQARIRTSDGREFLPNPNHLYYRGMISGDPHSLAIVSVFPNRIQILWADNAGNHRLQRTPDGSYIAFRDLDVLQTPDLECHADEVESPARPADPGGAQRMMTGNCIQVYVECDYKSYQDNGSSVPNTEEWVGELWNEVTTLYDNEDVPVAVSDIHVYTSSDPFANLNTTSAILSAFRAHIDTLTYNGRLAHLLSTRSIGGGIAYLNTLCNTSGYQVAVSASLSTNIIPVPSFSWTVEVVTHEMGHNLGSPHTHACAWNGNNTAIDGCGPTAGYSEGSCPMAPLPTNGGTIMSYCHLVSGVGINFNNGFGPQPGDLIRDKYNTATCNTGTCSPPDCVSMTLPEPGQQNADIQTDVSWASSPGANGYRLTIGTTPTNGSIANNLDVGPVTTWNIPVNLAFNTTYYVKVVPYNNLGDAPGCATQQFTTEANVQPACTAVNLPANGADEVPVNAILYWPHSVGNQSGYKISIGTTPGGTQVVNNLNVGNVTSYDHPTSFAYATTYYVRITPYGQNGDVPGCAETNFTTLVPLSGDFCVDAIQLDCGDALTGNTIGALPDTPPNCGVSITAPGIWYTFTGNGQNTIITTCTQFGYDTQLHAYSGSCTGLSCVAANDDFCTQGSSLNFATTNGTQYYVLVNGWGGGTGSYTLTRSCYPGPLYCQSQSNSAASEWISGLTVGSFTKSSGATVYSNFTGDTIEVPRGVGQAIQITPSFAQGARSEYYRVWVDLNRDGDFNDANENVFSAGPTTGSPSGTITIPLTTATGPTRMRVSMRYNSAPGTCSAPGSSGNGFSHGEVEDYTLNIRCNMVTSTSDSGNGSLRNVSLCVEDGEDVLFAPSLNGQIINVTLGPITSDGTWKWMAGPGTNITIRASNVTRILSIPAGQSAEIQNLKLIGGTASLGSAIDNSGDLILRDCEVEPAVGNSGTLIRNSGMMEVLGNCIIRY